MDKQYSVENIENLIRSPQSLISTVDQTMLLREFRAESERLLTAYKQLLARVKEAEAVEEMLGKIAIAGKEDLVFVEDDSKFTGLGFEDGKWIVREYWKRTGGNNSHVIYEGTSLSSALQSLIKE